MDELKPCPFCGWKTINYFNGWKHGDREKDGGKWRSPSITCEGCEIGFSAGSFGFGISDEEAKDIIITAWNTRFQG